MERGRAIVESLRPARRIGLDTSVFIYHLEQTSPHAFAAGALLHAIAEGQFEGVTTVISLLEITIKPLRLGRPEVADIYEALIANIPNLIISNLDSRATRIGAELRANYGLRTPDALQIAGCLACGAETFITNDRRLRRVTEAEVRLLADFL